MIMIKKYTRGDELEDGVLVAISKLEQEKLPHGFRQRDATHMMLFYSTGGNALLGKVEYHAISANVVEVDWFLAPNYGIACFHQFIKSNLQFNLIRLVCVADPAESTDTVLRRFNFYTHTIGGFHFINVQYQEGGAVKFMLEKKV